MMLPPVTIFLNVEIQFKKQTSLFFSTSENMTMTVSSRLTRYTSTHKFIVTAITRQTVGYVNRSMLFHKWFMKINYYNVSTSGTHNLFCQ